MTKKGVRPKPKFNRSSKIKSTLARFSSAAQFLRGIMPKRPTPDQSTECVYYDLGPSLFCAFGQNSLQKTVYGGKTNQSKRSRFRTVPRGPEIPGNMIRYFDFWGSKSTALLAKIGWGWKNRFCSGRWPVGSGSNLFDWGYSNGAPGRARPGRTGPGRVRNHDTKRP